MTTTTSGTVWKQCPECVCDEECQEGDMENRHTCDCEHCYITQYDRDGFDEDQHIDDWHMLRVRGDRTYAWCPKGHEIDIPPDQWLQLRGSEVHLLIPATMFGRAR